MRPNHNTDERPNDVIIANVQYYNNTKVDNDVETKKSCVIPFEIMGTEHAICVSFLFF